MPDIEIYQILKNQAAILWMLERVLQECGVNKDANIRKVSGKCFEDTVEMLAESDRAAFGRV